MALVVDLFAPLFHIFLAAPLFALDLFLLDGGEYCGDTHTQQAHACEAVFDCIDGATVVPFAPRGYEPLRSPEPDPKHGDDNP